MTDQADKKRIEALELENVALRKRVMILEGAHKVLTKRILAVFQKPRASVDPDLTVTIGGNVNTEHLKSFVNRMVGEAITREKRPGGIL